MVHFILSVCKIKQQHRTEEKNLVRFTSTGTEDLGLVLDSLLVKVSRLDRILFLSPASKRCHLTSTFYSLTWRLHQISAPPTGHSCIASLWIQVLHQKPEILHSCMPYLNRIYSFSPAQHAVCWLFVPFTSHLVLPFC